MGEEAMANDTNKWGWYVMYAHPRVWVERDDKYCVADLGEPDLGRGISFDDLKLRGGLLAASPEMYEALRKIADPDTTQFDDVDPYDGLARNSVRDFARAAIAKAEGQEG
jgi:hypothetical protein